jgi:hypothetical protein
MKWLFIIGFFAVGDSGCLSDLAHFQPEVRMNGEFSAMGRWLLKAHIRSRITRSQRQHSQSVRSIPLRPVSIATRASGIR